MEPRKNIPEALTRLAESMAITGVSTFYCTPALNRPEQPDYLNGVVAVTCSMTPRDLKFEILRPIEASLGRMRNADRYAARPIDLDILIYGDLVVNEPDLCIPDPDLRERAFLAAGLLELAPDLVLPDSGKALSDVIDRIETQGLNVAHGFAEMLRERLSL